MGRKGGYKIYCMYLIEMAWTRLIRERTSKDSNSTEIQRRYYESMEKDYA